MGKNMEINRNKNLKEMFKKSMLNDRIVITIVL